LNIPVAISACPYISRPSLTNQSNKIFSLKDCGVPIIQPSLGQKTRIVGGTPAVKNSWPWQAFITDGRSMCGASLINSQV